MTTKKKILLAPHNSKVAKHRIKLIRVTTHDVGLEELLKDQLKFFKDSGFESIGLAADTGRLKEIEENQGVRCINLPMQREISILKDLKSLWKMYRVFRNERPDIVHANTPKGVLLSMIGGMLAQVPIRIYSVTGLRFETATGFLKRILKWTERISCWCATEVIPEGDGVSKVLKKERITNKPLRKIHFGNVGGVDLEYFNPTLFTKESHNFVRFIFVGRITKDKGINELVNAFDQLHKEYSLTRLLLVGRFEEDLDPINEKVKERIMLGEGIEQAGYVKDIRPQLMSSDILILPSYREGFPNVILQAGAMNLPVIITDVNGADEVIIPNVNGFIIPKQDTNAIIMAMKQVIDNPHLIPEMAKNCRGIIESKFDRKDVLRATLERYRELLSKNKKTRKLLCNFETV